MEKLTDKEEFVLVSLVDNALDREMRARFKLAGDHREECGLRICMYQDLKRKLMESFNMEEVKIVEFESQFVKKV